MMKCKDCDTDMKELFDNLLRKLPARSASWEENMAVPVRGEFVTREGKIVSLYVCPKCGRVQGEFYKKNGRVVKYC